MDIRKCLPETDKELMLRFLQRYNDAEESFDLTADHFLREWAKQKEKFFSAFGNQFIISKNITISASLRMLQSQIGELYDADHWIFYALKRNYSKKIYNMKKDLCFCDRMAMESLMSPGDLVDNIYSGDEITIPMEYTINRKPFTVKTGCKVIKTLAKLINLLNCDIPVYVCKHCQKCFDINENPDLKECPHCYRILKKSTAFEEFRLKHSQILNQKKVSGKLCLSIHPMDYLTMSDNDCGWDSCMSWVEKAGEYRLGTIEMMNSPSVIVAYLMASHPFETGVGEWNNKKWRQLIIVDPAMIVGNRQYPDNNSEVESVVMSWVKDLIYDSEEFKDYHYEDEISVVKFSEEMTLPSEKKVYIQFSTGYMYNDLYEDRHAYINIPYLEQYPYLYYTLQFSGVALCANCGKLIPFNENHPEEVVCCDSCCQLQTCCGCGESVVSRQGYYNDLDEFFCESCWDDLSYCDCCGNKVISVNAVYVAPPGLKQGEIVPETWPEYFLGHICDECDCNENLGRVEYIEFAYAGSRWTSLRNAVRLENLTDDCLHRSILPVKDIDELIQIRDKYSEEAEEKS